MKNLLLFKGWTLLYCILACIVSGQSFATSHTDFSTALEMTAQQQTTITGTVTYNNMPMTGVTITVKGKNATAISGEDGKFSIAANGNDTLIFEYLGFKTQVLTINNKTHLTVQLEEDVNDLKEVTVNAGYYKVKDKERTGSISKITAKDIEKQPVTNILAAMQGRMAGVNITQDSGIPGGGFNIQIRGQNSLRADGNAPLYIIDGVPYASDPIGATQTSTPLSTVASPLNSINPDDIESIEILKDADATAIYGSRGANGVVLLTIKRGKAGKTKITAGVSAGSGHVTRFMDLMNTQQYLDMRRQAFANDGITTIPAYAYDINGTWDQNRQTDWQKKLFGGNSEINAANVSVSGGSEQTQFLVSGNFHSETTVFPGDFLYKKANVHFSINHKSEDEKFKISLTGGYTKQKNNQPGSDLTREALYLPPNAPSLYDANGDLNWENSTFNNPLRNLEGKYLTDTGDLVANSLISYELFKGLELRSSFGFTDLHFTESSSLPYTMYDPAYGLGAESSGIFINNTARRSWIAEPQINWETDFGKAKVDLLVGGTFQNQQSNQMIQSGFGYSSNSLLYNLSAATEKNILADNETIYRYQAFFGRANFNWDKKYIVNVTGRRDGSSRFGPDSRFANFGAVGVAWVFSNESWIRNHAEFLSFGKLRGSYGTTGSDQIGDYQYLDTYSTTATGYGSATGLTPTRLYNPDFGWEVNKKLELALETGFLSDRIFLTTAWFRNRSSSQLVGLPLPGTTGFSSIQANLDATVENTGLEFTLATANIRKGNFKWNTSINLTIPKNRLLSFPGLEGSTYANTFVIGQSVNIRKLYQSTGVDPQTGLYTFTDYNGDGVISAPDDQQLVKDFSPKYYGGVQNTISYYGIQLDFLFQFVKQQNYNFTRILGLPGGAINMASDAVGNTWQQPGDNAEYQRFTSGADGAAVDAYYKFSGSDKAATDASFVRLKNISLAYELPTKWTHGIICRLSLQGQNLWTVTKYKGADPEFTNGGLLPPLKIITTGLQLTF